jgi:hypothetical protein
LQEGQVFYSALKAKKLEAQIVELKTVNYHCMWKAPYRTVGKTPPPDARPAIDYAGMKQWLASQSPRQMEILHRRIGYKLNIRRKGKAGPLPE